MRTSHSVSSFTTSRVHKRAKIKLSCGSFYMFIEPCDSISHDIGWSSTHRTTSTALTATTKRTTKTTATTATLFVIYTDGSAAERTIDCGSAVLVASGDPRQPEVVQEIKIRGRTPLTKKSEKPCRKQRSGLRRIRDQGTTRSLFAQSVNL